MKAGNTVWEIEPQVVLDASSGVSVTSRADFVLWPVREAVNANLWSSSQMVSSTIKTAWQMIP